MCGCESAFAREQETFSMDDTTAADIIKSFATRHRGAAPAAHDRGEAAPSDAAPSHAAPDAGDAERAASDLARALFLAADALESRARLAARRQAGLPRNAGKPWTAHEDEQLCASFDAGKTIDALAGAHERTRAGIEARLVRHGRLDEHAARGGQGLRYPARERSPPG
jgi:hypothetical protein